MILRQSIPKSPRLALGVAGLRSPYSRQSIPKSPRLALGVAGLRSPYSSPLFPFYIPG